MSYGERKAHLLRNDYTIPPRFFRVKSFFYPKNFIRPCDIAVSCRYDTAVSCTCDIASVASSHRNKSED